MTSRPLSRRAVLALGTAATLAACTRPEDRGPVAASAGPTPAPSALPPSSSGNTERLGEYRLPERGSPGGLDWSPKGDRLAVTGPSLLVLFPATGQPVVLRAHGQLMATSVAWSPDGTRLVSVGTDGTAQFWNPAGGTAPVHTLPVKNIQRHGLVRWSPAGNLVVVSTGSVPYLIDVSGAAPAAPVAGTNVDVLYDLAWAPDGKSFYVAGAGGVSRWPAAGGQPLATLKDPAVTVWRSLAVAPDGRVLVSARVSGRDSIRIFGPDLTAPGPDLQVPTVNSTTTATRWSPDGRRMAVGFQFGPIGAWEFTGTGGRYLGGYEGHPKAGDGGYGLAWQPGTDRIASLDADGSIHLWRVRP